MQPYDLQASMTNREKGKDEEELEWRNRGNRVDLVRGERKKVELR